MILQKIIKTDKATILVIGGLPEDAKDIKTIPPLLRYVINNEIRVSGAFIPPGKWQPVGFLKSIYESEAETIIPESFYTHLDKKRGLWYAALFWQFIEEQIPLRNSKPQCDCKLGTRQFEECPHINKSVTSCTIYEAWQAEQEKVFINPFLLKEID